MDLTLESLDDLSCAALSALSAWLDELPVLAAVRISCREENVTPSGALALVKATQKLVSIQIDFPAYWQGFATTGHSFANLVTAELNLGYWPPNRAEPVTALQAATLTAERLPQLRYLLVHEGELDAVGARTIANSDLGVIALGFDGVQQPSDSLLALANGDGLPNLCHLHLRETGADAEVFAVRVAAGVRVDV